MTDFDSLWALRKHLESRIGSSLDIAKRISEDTEASFVTYLESAQEEANALNQAYDYAKQREAIDHLVQKCNEQKSRLEGLEK